MKINLGSLFNANWSYRNYRIFVINTKTTSRLYLWDRWALLFQPLNRLIELAAEKAFIRSFQSFKSKNKWLGFGRMQWNEKNNIIWTTKYRKNISLEDQPDFFATEIWAPDWNQVCQTGMPPNIFIKLYNYSNTEGVREGLIIALPQRLYKANREIVDDVITKLNLNIPNSKVYETKRGWWGRVAVRNNVEDMNVQEIQEIVNSNK